MVTDRLSAASVTVERIDVSPDFPAFQPEIVDDPPDAVRMVRRALEQADGLVFSVPEYAGGMPGWVKNVTDWMVGSASLFERPVAVVSAATGGGAHAIEQLTRTLIWQGAFVVSTCSIPAPLTMVRDGAVTDADALARLYQTGDTLLAVLRGEADAAELTADTLRPLGIDPLDRLI
jgi:NAD(P)H-dependent FMN reductase